MILLLDNYDSFTYNLRHYLAILGAEVLVLRNDREDLPETAKRAQGLIISPGPSRPSDSGFLMDVLDICVNRIPVLGVCLGHQAIGEYFGARLVKAEKPVHGKVSSVTHQGHPMFRSIPTSFPVTRYHSLLLQHDEVKGLVGTAFSDQGEWMALAHETLPVWGVQYHPEAVLSHYGYHLIRNWLQMVPLV